MADEIFRDLPIIAFADPKDWMDWLEEHHGDKQGIWVKFAKKASGIATINYVQAREGALIYGWIDGQVYRYDEQYYLQRFTPRRAGSGWSKINCELVEGYIREGRMKPAGLAQVEAAKADGRWEAAYDAPSSMEVPPELQAALDGNPKAKSFFDSLSRSNRYAFLYRIQTAKRPETRTRHIQKTIQMLEAGRTYH